MAEVLATMVVGPLLSMVKDKASSYLLDQYNVMEGMEEQHKLLKRKLPAVLDVITYAEEQAAQHREGAKAWLEEVRMVAYKANDVLDEFKYEALRRKARKEGHYKELGMDVIKLFPSHNRFKFRYKMANKLQMVLQELDVLITEMNTFRFKFKPQPPMSSLTGRHTNPHISNHSMDIADESRAQNKKKIVDALLGQKRNASLTVLPIFGMGGMGKTTLAQLVYNDTDIQKQFQVRLWVCVSENFDVDSLVERIVEAARDDGCEIEGNSALEKLQNALSGKRYLLVLDDVWNRDPIKWDKLKSHLPHGGNGSSVLTTTRDKMIADIMHTMDGHQITGLDEKFIKEIIKNRAFSSQVERPAALFRMVGEVAKRCSGSPLAATALGSVLSTKNSVEEWKVVLSRNTICDEENEILPILKLSYNCLPPHMRQCFAFCAMFPKDYEIDVEMLIQLWMANGFISEQQGVCYEFTGKQIFNELTQRSFFQEVKQVTFHNELSSRLTCKIHDLMHDVAQNSMGKECATIDTIKLSKSGDFPFSARHLFLSFPQVVLKASQKKGCPAIQTLICDGDDEIVVQDFSKFRSVRALKIRQGSFKEMKYLHHLRYLDLSFSRMKALPEDITILYHLQTLNLSNCRLLERLPKAMKYMAALRHLYTNKCGQLKSMPAGLGQLTSLQTLTCYVAGTVPGCSNVGELELLDLGGQLELRQLENVTGADAKAAQLVNKKRLERLDLTWSSNNSSDKVEHMEVLKGLEPHDGLKAMSIGLYGGSTIPTWILKLKDMVKLKLYGCENLEKLPALWQLPDLQFLDVSNMENLHCLFSGGTPSKFQKLKSMSLSDMPKFETWWDRNEVQGGEPIFPEVEKLVIKGCRSLTALPRAARIKESSSEFRSAFPALREMVLRRLKMLCRWEEAVQGSQGEHQVTTFPRLEELEIWECPELFSSYPNAPKLGRLVVEGGSDETPLLQAARRYYITSLSSLSLDVARDDTAGAALQANRRNRMGLPEPDKDEWNINKLSPLEYLYLWNCNVFFSSLSAALAPWTCFGQLVHLIIGGCDDLVHWPEKAFQGLVSLRKLEIRGCSKLTGESAAAGQSGGLLPRLESLEISYCEALVEVPKLPASLKTLCIHYCNGLKGSMVFISGQHKEEEEVGERIGEGIIVIEPDTMSSLIPPGAVPFPCLELLVIRYCDGLSEVANLPPSIKSLEIRCCSSLGSLLPSGTLEHLTIDDCGSLVDFPINLPSSLKTLDILRCHKVKFIEFGGQLQQQEKETTTRLVSGEGAVLDRNRSTSSSIIAAGSSRASSTVLVMKLSSPPNLESLVIDHCSGLSEVANLPPSIKTLGIYLCPGLRSLLGEFPPSLRDLGIYECPRLESLPNGPQGAYSSLRTLQIKECTDMRQLPTRLQQRLDYLDEKDLDPHLVEGSTKTPRCAALMSKLVPSRLGSSNLLCFTSKSEED